MLNILKYFGVCLGAFCYINMAFGVQCQNGYVQIGYISNTLFLATQDSYNSVCQNSGYSTREIPADIYPVYSAYLMGTAPKLCDDGFLKSDGTCSSYVQGNCDSGYVNLAFDSSFRGTNDEYDTICQNTAYSIKSVQEDLYPLYSAYLMGNTTTLCPNGYLQSDGTCSTYTAGDCIENYYDLAVNNNTFTALSQGKCASTAYTKRDLTYCDRNPDLVCANIPTPRIDITWNYNDGTGATSTSQCYLEDLIELPPTPTRSGYIFGGWKVKKN